MHLWTGMKSSLSYSRLTDRAHQGERVDIEAVCRRPELANELRALWGAVLIADAAASASGERSLQRPPPSRPKRSLFPIALAITR